MNISEFFRITPDNIVQCVNYIVTLKTLKSVKYLDEGYDDPDNFDLTFEYFLNEEESDSYKTDYVDKHKLLSIQNVEKLNNPYTWMEGIKLRTDDPPQPQHAQGKIQAFVEINDADIARQGIHRKHSPHEQYA